MTAFPTEDRTRQRRAKSEQAIGLAMRNRWDEAAQVNREILEMFPNDVDAYNRLGKALMELGRYTEARDAYGQALKLDPANGIATKNLQRLAKVADGTATVPSAPALDPRLFIEESGKTTVTQVTDVRKGHSIAKLTAGDRLQLEMRGKQIIVTDTSGSDIGRIEPKLEHHLLRLLQMGNQYSVFVTSAADQAVNVIIRETHRSPEMGNRPSFRPSAAPEGGFRSYAREGMLRYEVEEEEEEEELLEEEEEEAEVEVVPADAEATTETTLDAIEADEEDVEETT